MMDVTNTMAAACHMREREREMASTWIRQVRLLLLLPLLLQQQQQEQQQQQQQIPVLLLTTTTTTPPYRPSSP